MTPAEMRELAANLCENKAKNHGWNYHLPSVGRELATAIRAIPIPDGDMVMVPRDPSAEMLEAGKKAWKKPRMHVNFNPTNNLNTYNIIYHTMLAAKE